jgi:uncharacterized OB-fold protein
VDAAEGADIVGDGFISTDRTGRVRLTVTRNRRDGTLWFPPHTAVGARAELEEAEVGPAGVVYASTVVRVGSAAFEPPYVLSYVDLDGVRVLAHSPGQLPLPPGTRVELVMGRIGHVVGDGTGGTRSGPAELHSYVAQPLAEADS